MYVRLFLLRITLPEKRSRIFLYMVFVCLYMEVICPNTVKYGIVFRRFLHSDYRYPLGYPTYPVHSLVFSLVACLARKQQVLCNCYRQINCSHHVLKSYKNVKIVNTVKSI